MLPRNCRTSERSTLVSKAASCLALVLSLSSAPSAYADKLVASAGGYSFSAENKSNRTSSSISGVGSYQLSYRQSIRQNFELEYGVSLLATQAVSGDLSYGIDVGVNYYPFTSANNILGEFAGAHFYFKDLWRPFLGLSFNQRNFQSSASTFAGFGLKLGTEFLISPQWNLHVTLRYLSLGGPNKATAVQIDALSGIIIQF